jgi:hypothetical protein
VTDITAAGDLDGGSLNTHQVLKTEAILELWGATKAELAELRQIDPGLNFRVFRPGPGRVADHFAAAIESAKDNGASVLVRLHDGLLVIKDSDNVPDLETAVAQFRQDRFERSRVLNEIVNRPVEASLKILNYEDPREILALMSRVSFGVSTEERDAILSRFHDLGYSQEQIEVWADFEYNKGDGEGSLRYIVSNVLVGLTDSPGSQESLLESFSRRYEQDFVPYIIATNGSREPIVPEQSEGIIADRSVVWHAIRGYDFAGLESMLRTGLLPAENQGEYRVCVSVSPHEASSLGRPANSFYAYTLSGGLSLAIKFNSPISPSGDHGGFLDEARFTSISSDSIIGVMLPDEALALPLSEVSTMQEPRKPLQATRFIDRTLAHLASLGGELEETTNGICSQCRATSSEGRVLTKQETSVLQETLMREYSKILATRLGKSEPTVGDALALIFERAEVGPKVFRYTEEQKREWGRYNAYNASRPDASRSSWMHSTLLNTDDSAFWRWE